MRSDGRPAIVAATAVTTTPASIASGHGQPVSAGIDRRERADTEERGVRERELTRPRDEHVETERDDRDGDDTDQDRDLHVAERERAAEHGDARDAPRASADGFIRRLRFRADPAVARSSVVDDQHQHREIGRARLLERARRRRPRSRRSPGCRGSRPRSSRARRSPRRPARAARSVSCRTARCRRTPSRGARPPVPRARPRVTHTKRYTRTTGTPRIRATPSDRPTSARTPRPKCVRVKNSHSGDRDDGERDDRDDARRGERRAEDLDAPLPTGDGAKCAAVPNISCSSSARNSAMPSVAMSASSGGRCARRRITSCSASAPSSAPTTTATTSVEERRDVPADPGDAAFGPPQPEEEAERADLALGEREDAHPLKMSTTPTATSA